ncbi:MAG TPA: hypothetical protein VL742_19480 [Casimicrobiaceae bacterium]|nr:hypothetical protein [Casimicrobiaceae bacterium]
MTPLPPLPASTIERLESARADRTCPAGRASVAAAVNTSTTPGFPFRQVKRLRSGRDLMQIKAFVIAMLHDARINQYYGTVIPE